MTKFVFTQLPSEVKCENFKSQVYFIQKNERTIFRISKTNSGMSFKLHRSIVSGEIFLDSLDSNQEPTQRVSMMEHLTEPLVAVDVACFADKIDVEIGFRTSVTSAQFNNQNFRIKFRITESVQDNPKSEILWSPPICVVDQLPSGGRKRKREMGALDIFPFIDTSDLQTALRNQLKAHYTNLDNLIDQQCQSITQQLTKNPKTVKDALNRLCEVLHVQDNGDMELISAVQELKSKYGNVLRRISDSLSASINYSIPEIEQPDFNILDEHNFNILHDQF